MDLDDAAWRILLRRLERAQLIKLRGGPADADPIGAAATNAAHISSDPSNPGIDAHPLIREWFAKQLRDQAPTAFAAAHARLFEHLCTSTPHRPDDLDGLQPLYQAVVHGVLAGREQEACDKVYIDRILRGTGNDGFYSTRKLGAIGPDLGAVAAFFDAPWQRVTRRLAEADRAWLLNQAAFRLRALGRLTEALEPMRAGLEMRVRQKVWKSAAIIASNLSELELSLGRLPAAVADARQAIDHAERSGDWAERMGTRTTAADALHQSGERDAALALFHEAEQLQQQRQPEYPLLYSLRGFQYCDCLLAPAERAAWQALGSAGLPRVRRLQPAPRPVAPAARPGETDPQPDHPLDHQAARQHPPHPPSTDSAPPAPSPSATRTTPAPDPATPAATDAEPVEPGLADPLALCDEAERRATTALGWFEDRYPLLSIALDHLTLARTTLLRALLTDPATTPPRDLPALTEAVAGLRNAGAMHYLPKALLTTAWHQALRGAAEPARLALDEAQAIAERGPMPLYLADCLLLRARLWSIPPLAGTDYPWPDTTPTADLKAARRLIEQHHYYRRLPELEDAEAAREIATAISRDL